MKQSEPRFLGLEGVMRLHDLSLEGFGGSAGVRDHGLIESALASAQHAWHYGNGDFFDIAAAYAFHIAQAQAFIDGNKRTAVAAAIIFLKGNGYPEIPDDGTVYNAMISIAEKQMDKAELADVLRRLYGAI